MDKKIIKLPTADDARKEMDKERRRRKREEKKKLLQEKIKEEIEPRNIDDVVYDKMLKSVYYSILVSTKNLKDSCSVEIECRYCENEDNLRKRKALDKIKTLLRSLGYQVCWSLDQVEYGNYELPSYDELRISWDKTIRWNDFHP